MYWSTSDQEVEIREKFALNKQEELQCWGTF